MVGVDASAVEADLVAGRLRGPCCDGPLRPWGWARRRAVREGLRLGWWRPRRSRCRCGVTHVLLPVVALWRRRDAVAVIGAAVLAWHAGAGHRRIAAGVGVPATTVRGWLRRFAVNAGFLAAQFAAVAHVLDRDLGRIEPQGSPVGDALEAVGVAASAAARRFGASPVWSFAAGASGGRLLANTSSPFPLLG
jgi:hypothetical protein